MLSASSFTWLSPTARATAAGATIIVTGDSDDTVAGLAGNSACDLREAILAVNTNTAVNECIHNGSMGTDTIQFSLGTGNPSIAVTGAALPDLIGPVIIDGASGGAIRVELNGTATGTDVDGMTLRSGASGSELRSLVINRFSRDGIVLDGPSQVKVVNCLIGTDTLGTDDLGNGRHGVVVIDGRANTIGGVTRGIGNVISGNQGWGIQLWNSSDNLIQGNYIGTDMSGSIGLGNDGKGVFISEGQNNLVGGTVSGAGNVISDNRTDGIEIRLTTGAIIQGNLIGTDAHGAVALGNYRFGIRIDRGSTNMVGGLDAGAGNVISGNRGTGIEVDQSTRNVIQGNMIGTDRTGRADVGNYDGIRLRGPANLVGGTALGARNIISGNDNDGIVVRAPGNVVQGNLIGPDITGGLSVGNRFYGISILGTSDNIIGGVEDTAGNVMSGNGACGISLLADFDGWSQYNRVRGNLSWSQYNLVQGNLIGTDASGVLDLGNGSSGVCVSGGSDNTFGGTQTGAGNVISGNRGAGVLLDNGEFNVVQGNLIGLNRQGRALGNRGDGVLIRGGWHTSVGGADAGAGNSIAYNHSGVTIVNLFRTPPSANNTILSNSIFNNSWLGIDLDPTGVTANDPLDDDTGANSRQNFPALNAVRLPTDANPQLVVTGTLNSLANTSFRVELFANHTCDGSGHGEGQFFLGSALVTTDEVGNASFSTSIQPTTEGPALTATATRLEDGQPIETSEFSACRWIKDVPVFHLFLPFVQRQNLAQTPLTR